MRLSLRYEFDWLLFCIPLLLVAVGIAVIFSLAPSAEPGSFPLAWTQAMYAGLGVVVMVLLSLLDYRTFRAAAPPLFALGLVLLVLVLIVGSVQFGARRWIDLGPFQLQPSELMKLLMVVMAAWFFAGRDDIKVADVVAALILVVVPTILVLRQPDFGTAALIILGVLPIFVLSKMTREQWIGLAALALIALPLILASLQPYQRERLQTFLDPSRDPFGTGYNVLQSTIAIGSGGLTGRGLGQGTQSTLAFVPVAHTDFIFAGIAEASGFVGSALFLTLFGVLLWRAFRVGIVAQDRFGRMLAVGIGTVWFCSVFINVGMNLGLVPVTGIPLPFVSFGGSSLVTSFAMIGILQSIYMRRQKISFQ